MVVGNCGTHLKLQRQSPVPPPPPLLDGEGRSSPVYTIVHALYLEGQRQHAGQAQGANT